MGQLYTVGPAQPVQVSLDAYATSATVENLGPDTVYYAAGSTVSAATHDGALVFGSTLTITTGTAFAAQTSTARLYVFDAVASSASAGLPLGLVGATAPTRYAGGTTAGPPTSGTFAVGDFAIDQVGTVWVCTLAGTPGTWAAATSQELGYAQLTTNTAALGPASTSVPGLSITVTPPTTQLRLVFGGVWQKDATASYVWTSFFTGATGGTEVNRAVDSVIASGFVTQTLMAKVTGLTPGTAQTYRVSVQCGAGAATLDASTPGDNPFIQAFAL